MATTAFNNTVEGYSASPTTVTTGNSGSGSGDAWSLVTTNGGTIEAVTAAKKHGTYGYRLTRSGTSQVHLQKTLAADITDFVGQHWSQVPAQPNGVLFKGYSDTAATVTSWAVNISGTGKLVVLAGTGSTTVHTSTATIPTGADVRWEYEVVSGTSVRVVAFSGDSNTVLADSGTIATTLVAATRTFRIGLLTTIATPASIDLDDIRLGTGPGLFGLSTVARPTSLVSNPGAYTTTGAGSPQAALADDETSEAAPASYIESTAAPAGTQVTFATTTLLPSGALLVERWDSQDVASPIIDSKLDVLVGGVVIGTNTIPLTTTVTQTTFTTGVATGDMSTLQFRYTDTTR